MNGSFWLDDAAELGGGFSGGVDGVEEGVAPGDVFGGAEDEEAVGAAEGFGEEAGFVDLIGVVGDADEEGGGDVGPVGEEGDEENACFGVHNFILR